MGQFPDGALGGKNEGHAIHGLAADAEWSIERVDQASIDLEIQLKEIGWPFDGVVRQSYRLSDSALTMSATVTALDNPFPVSVGWHPWFLMDDTTSVRVRASEMLELDRSLLPTGRILPVDERRDLRCAPHVAGRELDDVYVDPSSPIQIEWEDFVLTMGFENPVNTVVVFTTDHAVCVEPQTAWPDMVTLDADPVGDTGMVMVNPSHPLMVEVQWNWRAK